MTPRQRINGFPVFRADGKDFSTQAEGYPQRKEAINGPHHDAKWARDLLGTNATAGQRRIRSIISRLPLYTP